MRILHSIHSLNPRGGGPVEAVRQLGRINTARGHQIEVLCLDTPGAEWLRDFPLPVHALGPGRLRYGYTPRLVPWIRAHRDQYDAVIVNGIWQYNSFGVRRALGRGSPPYGVFLHGMLDPWFKRAHPLDHLKKWLYWPWAEYRVLRDALAVFFTCEEERRLARQSFWLYRCREQVVHYGTSAPPGDPACQRSLFFDRFPDLHGRRLFLFLGRIHPKKGCDLLIRAFARILNNLHPPPSALLPPHLVIAGPDSGGSKAQLERLAQELNIASRITWTGMLEGDLKWGAFRAAEAFVLPSHQENFGLAIAEALACGVPVLISDKINIWREIESAGAGFVEPDNAEGAARLLDRWLGLPPDRREQMRLDASRCFRDFFDLEGARCNLIEALRAAGVPG